jgi:hypothetical protein
MTSVRNRRQRQNLEGWTRQKITPAPPVPKPTSMRTVGGVNAVLTSAALSFLEKDV